eukprot:jgi/Chrzof1/7678/Cz02g32190.t1
MQRMRLLLQDAVQDAASQLGLLQASSEEQLYLFQLPCVLPVAAPRVKDDPGGRHGAAGRLGSLQQQPQQQHSVQAGAAFKDLPSGKLGKLKVFESGKVKLQIGGVLLDVSSGMPCLVRQDVAAINHEAGHCVLLGAIEQRAVVCPDVWQLMQDLPVPDFVAAAAPSLGDKGAGMLRGSNNGHVAHVANQFDKNALQHQTDGMPGKPLGNGISAHKSTAPKQLSVVKAENEEMDIDGVQL